MKAPAIVSAALALTSFAGEAPTGPGGPFLMLASCCVEGRQGREAFPGSHEFEVGVRRAFFHIRAADWPMSVPRPTVIDRPRPTVIDRRYSAAFSERYSAAFSDMHS